MKDQDIRSLGDMVRSLGSLPFDPQPIGESRYFSRSGADTTARMVENALRQQDREHAEKLAAIKGELYRLSTHLISATAILGKVERLLRGDGA